MANRSIIDLKKVLGSYQQDWMRILINTYIYDRLKCIYYGVNAKYIHTIPTDLISFPGHILLFNALALHSFNFSTDDNQPFNLYLNIKYDSDLKEMFKEIFEIIPDLEYGMSTTEGIYSYVNTTYESVLRGLNNFKDNKFNRNSGNKLSNLFFTNGMHDETIRSYLTSSNNPLLNSFFSTDFKNFYFIMPIQKSTPEALRYNESLFISRALGFTGTQLEVSDNNLYTFAKVNSQLDRLIREDLYSVTGIKTEAVNMSMEQIKFYLSINSYTSGGSSNGTNPSGG